MTRLCQVMQVSRRGYYDWLSRPESRRSLENRELLLAIKRIFIANREVYGAPRIHSCLVDEGYQCSLNRVARLMREAHIQPKTVKKFKLTTDSRNSRHPAKNILSREFNAQAANEKWVSDVTFIPTREGWLYLAVILDLYSRKIVGWSMGSKLTAQLAKRALENALSQREEVGGCLIHSDRGKEYYAREYQQKVTDSGMIPSMSGLGDCYDNAPMESFFHSLKVEQVHHDDYFTRDEARAALFDYIELFYNRRRKHSSIGFMSPEEFESANGYK